MTDLIAGPSNKCKVCQFGFHSRAEQMAKEGKNWEEIKAQLKKDAPFLYKASGIKREDIQRHLKSDHCQVKWESVKIAQTIKKDIALGKSTAQEALEKMMQYISTSLGLIDGITNEDLDDLPVRAKFDIMAKASSIMQKGQDIALKAKAQSLNENKFLLDIGALASGSNHTELIETKEGNETTK